MVKSHIRKEYSERRNRLSDDEITVMEEAIVDNFRSVPLQGVQVLLSYYPLQERKEFNTIICEQLLMLENPGLQICWPRLEADGITMQAVPIRRNTVLTKNKYNIPEPDGDEIVAPQLVDAVFVPLLAFDTKGYRVGYGKGYYDRFLPGCAQDVVKIGFSYFEALDAIGDIDQFDVPLNFCITPTRVYEF